MMKCHSVHKKLSAYQDRELEPRKQEQVRSHLLSCRTCREQFAQLERTWQTLGELKEIHPDPWFYRQLIGKIKEPHERALLPTLRDVFRLLRPPVAATIILVVGLLAGTYLGSILARYDLFPFRSNPVSDSRGVIASMRVFDPAPPGTFAEGYLRMVSHKESESR